jgi:CubicO group peptidase (beta-lactamase class C family)
MLGLIIERVSGQSYESFVREKIALPSGMNTTFQCGDQLIPSEMTRGYDVADGKLVPSRMYYEPNVRFDGGMCSTVSDLAKLPAALGRGTVLSVAAFDQMSEPTQLANGVTVDYGLGVRRGFVAGTRLWGHTGGWNSFWSTLAYYPVDDIAIVVLVNTDNSAEDALTIEGKVAEVVFEMGNRVPADLPLPPGIARMLSGDYQGEDGRVQILEKEDHLSRKIGGSERPAVNLLYKGDYIFGRPDYPLDRVLFHVVDGKSLGLSEYYNGVFYRYIPALDRSSGSVGKR